LATDQNDVIQAQQKLSSEQQLLSQAKSQLKSDPTNINLQRLVTAREFNVSVYQQQLQQVLNEFMEDQGYSYFELANRQEAERQATLEAERQRQLEAQRLADEEADRLAEEEYQKQVLAELQFEVERQAEADRQAELQRLAEDEARRQAEQEAQNNMLPPPLDPEPDFGGFDPIPLPEGERVPVLYGEPIQEDPIGIYQDPVYELPPMFEEQPVEQEPMFELPPIFEEPPAGQEPMFESFPQQDPFSFLQLGKGKTKGSAKKPSRTERLFTFESLTRYTERKESRKKIKEEDPFAFYGFNQPRTTVKKGKTVQSDDPFAFLNGAVTPSRRRIAKRSNILKPEDIFRF